MFKLWSKSFPNVNKFCSELVLSLGQISGQGRCRSRRRWERNWQGHRFDSAYCQTQRLEQRCLLDGSFTFQQIGETPVYHEGAGLLTQSVIDSQGNVFFAEYDTQDSGFSVNVIPAANARTGTPATKRIAANLEALSDFDAAGDSRLAYIHSSLADFGPVVTTSEDGSNESNLIVDVSRPIAYTRGVSFPRPSLGATAFLFKVRFLDSGSYIDLNTPFDAKELQLTGPGGPVELKAYHVVSQKGTEVEVSYAGVAPGGHWGPEDNGSYELSTVAGSVKDVAGNAIKQHRLIQFSLNWDNDAKYTRFDVPIPPRRVEHLEREGHDSVRNDAFSFANRSDFSQLAGSDLTGYSFSLRQVSLSNAGMIAAAGWLEDYPMIVTWDGSTNSVSGILLSD